MVYGSGLENRRGRKVTVGSNPTLSARACEQGEGVATKMGAAKFGWPEPAKENPTLSATLFSSTLDAWTALGIKG